MQSNRIIQPRRGGRFRLPRRVLSAFLASLVLNAVGGVAHVLAAEQPAQPTLSEADALASFDQVWEQVRRQYFDFERIESDWEQAREQLRPRAAQATDVVALREVLHELLDQIGESHFGILPIEAFEQMAALEEGADEAVEIAPEAPRASTGLAVRWVEGSIRVSEVGARSPASEAGIEPGWTLLVVDEFAIDPAVERIAAIADEGDRRRARTRLEYALQYRLTYPRPEHEMDLVFLDAAGDERRPALSGRPLEHGAVQIGYLPPMTFEFSLRRLDIPAGCVSVLSFSTWVPALIDEFQGRRDEIFGCDALVLDLRGNPGGVLATMVTLANDLFEETALLGTLLRSDARLEFRAFPRRVAMDGTRLSPFTGPVAVLIDSMSGSTSEMFAAGMQAQGRARLFGERSAGMALPSRMLPLASGDYLMYAFADYQDSLGRRIEGAGVQPDQPVPLDAENITDVPSPVLQAGLDWITDQLAP